MSQRLSFAHLKTIYSAWSFDSATGEAELRVESPEVAQAVTVALDESNVDDSGLSLLHGDLSKPLLGQTLRIAVGPPRGGLGLFFSSLSALLKLPRARVAEPRDYFLEGAGSQASQDLLARYRAVLILVGLMAESAAYLDREHAQLVFVKDGKFVVPVDYTDTDLRLLNTAAIERLRDAFAQDLHREQKLAILGEEIVTMAQTEPLQQRFRALLSNLDKLSDRFFAGYRLFASNFSYQKIRSELEEARLEYTGKIHKTLTDIQSQLLTIPVATVIVATQLKRTASIDDVFWANSAVLLGAFVFAGLLFLMIRNQTKTVSVVAGEVDRQRTKLRTEHPDATTTFDDVFASLDARIRDQRVILNVVRGVLVLGLALAAAGYLLLTGPAWAAVRSAWHCILGG